MTVLESFDVVIIGAGIAGASLAWALAPMRRVLLLERESQPGYRSTGRSAATLHRSYGNESVRALTAASAPFYLDPPSGFAEGPLAKRRGVLVVARGVVARIGRRDRPLAIRRIESRWAGLRSFARDRTPVAGFDPRLPGFFWLAGQGGYGIQTAPALATLAAALITLTSLPERLGQAGVEPAALSPARLLQP